MVIKWGLSRPQAAGMFTLCLGFILLAGATAHAAMSKQYFSDRILQKGLLVSLGDNGNLYPAEAETGAALVGVVNSQFKNNQDDRYATEVITEGRVSAIASNANGAIRTGDKLSISAVAGVAAKATDDSGAIAVAVDDLRPSEGSYGVLLIDVFPGSSRGAPDQLSGLQGLVQAVTGKTVSTLRIIMAFIMIGLAFVFTALLISSSANSSIAAIGRNPLARLSIIDSFSKVLVLAFLTILVGFGIAATIVFI